MKESTQMLRDMRRGGKPNRSTLMIVGAGNMGDKNCVSQLLKTNRNAQSQWTGGAYLAKSESAKPESAIQETAKPYFAKPGNC